VTTKVNAGFYRMQQRNSRSRGPKQWINVQNMEFDCAFAAIKWQMVAAHPKAPAAAEGWILQGWCEQFPRVPT